MHHSNLLIHSWKTLSTVSTLISSRIFRTPERSSSANPHYCPWRPVLRFSNQKELEEAKSGEYGECGTIRKKLSSQNVLATFAERTLALSACTTNLFHVSFHSTPSTNLTENISDIAGGHEHLSFWLCRHRMASIIWNYGDAKRRLASISGCESAASLDRERHLHLAARSSHDLIFRQVEPSHDSSRIQMAHHPILDTGWITGDREVGSTARFDSTRLDST
jgi:hypothetical protein